MPGKVEDISNRLRIQIQTGKYGQLGSLPTIEGLAREFEVSKGVIVKAIERLQTERLLTRSGKRFYITVSDSPTVTSGAYGSLALKVGEPIFGLTPKGNLQYYDYLLFFPEGLQDPDGQDLSGIVFYVGKGTWYKSPLIQRIDIHEREAKWSRHIDIGENWLKVKAIRYIWVARKSVAKRVIFETLDEKEAINIEKQMIQYNTSPYLTNHENYAHCKVSEWPEPRRPY